MENETIHIAKVIAWPQMRAYTKFSKEIAKALTSPELQLVVETASRAPLPENPQSAMDWLCEESIKNSKGKIRGQSGPIETSTKKVGACLLALRETCERIGGYEPAQKSEGEKSFRDWLERGIIAASAFEEPSILAGDPILRAIQTVEAIRSGPLVFAAQDSDIAFPLDNFALVTKPKVTTSIEPFDENELEGGGEEDTVLILSGESNIGKSMLGLSMLSLLCLRKEPVLLCSGEDSLETTRRRILAHFLRRPTKDVACMSERERETLFESLYGDQHDEQSIAHHIKTNLAVACIPEGGFHPKVIEDRIDSFEQKTGRKVRAFMADYLQKMNENPAGKNPRRQRDEELEQTVNQIKALCQNRKVFGIVISQVPSHAAGGAFEFLNLRQAVARSYAATWGAHYVITMNRTAEETKRLASSPDKRPRLNLFLCKNKDGALGCCYALGYPNEARWEFYRTKAEMIGKIESDALTEERAQLNPADYKRTQHQRALG